MSKPYTIQLGDTLTRIAAREGYASWRDIYYHPDNSFFRARRPNPDRIHPGDVIILPGKAFGPPATLPAEGTSFALFLLRDSTDSRIAKAIVGPTGAHVRETATYRFQPRSVAEAMARKIGRQQVRSFEFQTPEPMTPRSFNGPMMLVQLINTGAAAMSRFTFTGKRRDGSPVALSVEMGTDASATELTVGPGTMTHEESGQVSLHENLLIRAKIA